MLRHFYPRDVLNTTILSRDTLNSQSIISGEGDKIIILILVLLIYGTPKI